WAGPPGGPGPAYGPGGRRGGVFLSFCPFCPAPWGISFPSLWFTKSRFYYILFSTKWKVEEGMKEFTAGSNEEGVRLSRFVEGVTQGMPRSLLYKSFRNKRIKVNGRRAEPDTRLAAGDVIQLYLNDEFFPEKPAPAPK